jgi:3-hydroxyisobutyrate dehydrogenase
MKLAMNLMMQVCWQSFGEAMALCAPLDLDPHRLVDVFSYASGAPPGLAHRLGSIADALGGKDISPVNFNVDSVRKDMRTMLEEAETMGIGIPVAQCALELFDAASAAGRGDEDCAMLPVRWMQAARRITEAS